MLRLHFGYAYDQEVPMSLGTTRAHTHGGLHPRAFLDSQDIRVTDSASSLHESCKEPSGPRTMLVLSGRMDRNSCTTRHARRNFGRMNAFIMVESTVLEPAQFWSPHSAQRSQHSSIAKFTNSPRVTSTQLSPADYVTRNP